MRKRLLLVVFSLQLGVAGMAMAQSKDEQAIRALIDQSVKASNTLDPKIIQPFMANISRSGGPFYHPFANVAGIQEVEGSVSQILSQISSRSYVITGPVTVRVDRSTAWAAFTWRSEAVFKDGTRRSYEGRATDTFVKEGKAWKFAHRHSSITAAFPLTKAGLEAEEAKVIETERGAWEALKNGQVTAMEEYFAEDASMFDDTQAYRVRGKSELLRGAAAWLQTTQIRSYQLLDPQVQVLGDTALLTYYFTMSIASAGKDSTQAGKASLVFVKQGGAWRALHEHISTNR